MSDINFPRTAVIYAESREERYALVDFLLENRFLADGNRPIDRNLAVSNECFDIEVRPDGKRVLCWSSREYYEDEAGFEHEFPELMPKDQQFWMCPAYEFIAICSGKDYEDDISVADDAEILDFFSQN